MITDLSTLLRSFLDTLRTTRDSDIDWEALREIDSEDRPNVAQAYAFLLVELAQVDGEFDPREIEAIERWLAEFYSLTKEEATPLIENAQTALASFQRAESFIQVIREHVSHDERARLVQALESITKADGQIRSEETAMLERLRTKLL